VKKRNLTLLLREVRLKARTSKKLRALDTIASIVKVVKELRDAIERMENSNSDTPPKKTRNK
jgi:hypothetical protein